MNSPSLPVDSPAPGAWEELVTTALLGTDRRTLPGCPPGQEAPVALLDLAAVETVRRRAGCVRRARRSARCPLPRIRGRRFLRRRPAGWRCCWRTVRVRAVAAGARRRT